MSGYRITFTTQERALVRDLLFGPGRQSHFWLLFALPFAVLAALGLVKDIPQAIVGAIVVCIPTQLLMYLYTRSHRATLREILAKYQSAVESNIILSKKPSQDSTSGPDHAGAEVRAGG